MNNDELKKKIVEIMSKVLEESVPCTAERKFECISDAFIAAGVGDVKETEHRAEVAERALNKFAENVTCEDCPFFSDCSSSEKMKDSVHPNYCYAEYLRQAEKELAEKVEDD